MTDKPLDAHCKCGHDIELHELEAIHLTDSTVPNCERIAWRFLCKGWRGTITVPFACTCTNYTLSDAQIAERLSPSSIERGD